MPKGHGAGGGLPDRRADGHSGWRRSGGGWAPRRVFDRLMGETPRPWPGPRGVDEYADEATLG
jgi:hypothetical protein